MTAVYKRWLRTKSPFLVQELLERQSLFLSGFGAIINSNQTILLFAVQLILFTLAKTNFEHYEKNQQVDGENYELQIYEVGGSVDIRGRDIVILNLQRQRTM